IFQDFVVLYQASSGPPSLEVEVRRLLDGPAGGAVADAEGEGVEPRLLLGRVEDDVLRVVGATALDGVARRDAASAAAEDAPGQARDARRGVLRAELGLDLVVAPAAGEPEAVDLEVEVDGLGVVE